MQPCIAIQLRNCADPPLEPPRHNDLGPSGKGGSKEMKREVLRREAQMTVGKLNRVVGRKLKGEKLLGYDCR